MKALQVLRRMATSVSLVSGPDPFIMEQEVTKKRTGSYVRSTKDPWFADPRMQRLL